MASALRAASGSESQRDEHRSIEDLASRTLGNAGRCCIGRRQTDADHAGALDGLAAARGLEGMDDELVATLQRLAPRWFVVRHALSSAS